MSNLKKVNEQITESIFLIGVFIFAISLLLPENYRNGTLFLFVITIVLKLYNNPSIKVLKHKVFLINTSLFFLLAISLIYSNDLDYGFKMVVRAIALLIIPLCFLLVSAHGEFLSKKRILLFYKVFFAATVIYFIGVFIFNYYRGFLNQSIFLHFSERMNSTYGKYSLHPLYASLYVSISLLLSIRIMAQTKDKLQRSLFYIGILFLIVVLSMLARKGPIIYTILIFGIYFFNKNKSKTYKALFVLVIITFLILSFLIEPIRIRYTELLDSLLHQKNLGLGSTSFRKHIYDCSFTTIFQEPLFGYGIGDTKLALTNCYINKDTIYSGLYFNSHNQLLSAWLSCGIAGALSFITLFYYNLKIALNKANFVHVSIVLLLFFVMMTENILERQNGVLLFSFFINLFAFKSLKSNKNAINDKSSNNRAIS